ncbi:MAG: flagellar brake protein [Eubacterium sp.]|nr:flagellar brake protein [Eubacterium sp.]
MKQVFSIGDKLEITPVKSAFSYDKSVKKYTSQVLDFDNVRTAKIAAPLVDGRLIPLRMDEDIELCFFTKAGLYQCRGRVKKRYSDGNVSVLDVLFVSEPQKFQRRRFYRLECSLEMKYRRLSREEIKATQELERARILEDEEKIAECEQTLEAVEKNWKDAAVTNISGGGIKFHLPESLEVGETIEVDIPISAGRGAASMKMMAHVIESSKSMDMRSSSADVRCEFDSIDNREREDIVKYVFEEQRRRMSGGER